MGETTDGRYRVMDINARDNGRAAGFESRYPNDLNKLFNDMDADGFEFVSGLSVSPSPYCRTENYAVFRRKSA